jgi:hypothetical protein
MYVYMKDGPKDLVLALRPSIFVVLPFLINVLVILHLERNVGLCL